MTRVAIMQPYFMPYAGYFRLFVDTDIFVIYDDVQFPKGGWVHRNRLPDQQGNPAWLTMPVKRMPLGSSIRELEYETAAGEKWQARLRRFPVLDQQDDALIAEVLELGDSPVGFLERMLRLATSRLALPFPVVRSSELDIAPDQRGPERVLEIVRQLGGTEYVNLPGGAALYDHAQFEAAGISLTLLPAYSGNMLSMLYRLLTEPASEITAEIRRNLEPGP